MTFTLTDIEEAELSLLLTGLDSLVRNGGLNSAQTALPLAAKLSEQSKRQGATKPAEEPPASSDD